MSKSWAGGSTRAWRIQRRRILNRDNHRCQLHYPGCTTIATEVHHVIGKGVSDRDDDLVAACRLCNNQAGDPRTTDPAPRPRTQW